MTQAMIIMQSIHKDLYAIWCDYEADNVKWSECLKQLEALQHPLDKVRIRDDKNYYFQLMVKNQLSRLIAVNIQYCRSMILRGSSNIKPDCY